MSVDSLRTLAGPVHEHAWPQLPCPRCSGPTLELVRATLAVHEDAGSKHDHGHEAFEPEWINGVFSTLLTCTISNCAEPAVASGRYHIAEDVDDNRNRTWPRMLKVTHIVPPLPLLAPPLGTPDTVLVALESASAVLWSDPGAAANRMRVAVDALLTAKGVRKLAPNRKRLTTHQRIVAFKAQEQDAGDVLEAVKWIGNTGSHEDRLTVGDVLDGTELFELALRLIYDKRDASLMRRVSQINTRRGVRHKRRRP